MTDINQLLTPNVTLLYKVSDKEVTIGGVNMSRQCFLKRMTDMGFERKETTRRLDCLAVGGKWILFFNPIQEYYLFN